MNKYEGYAKLIEVPKQEEQAKEELWIGDRVKIVDAEDYMGFSTIALRTRIGETAEIIAVTEYEDWLRYGIMFDEVSDELHMLDGRISQDSGYWVSAENIEKI